MTKINVNVEVVWLDDLENRLTFPSCTILNIDYDTNMVELYRLCKHLFVSIDQIVPFRYIRSNLVDVTVFDDTEPHYMKGWTFNQ